VEPPPDDITAAAQRAGVEVDAAEAHAWVVAAAGATDELVSDATGAFGHAMSMLDFDPTRLTHLRRLAAKVRLRPHDDVASAIAISGSSAQSRVQLFPGDADFFERVNVRAPSAEQARVVVRDLIRQTALAADAEPDVVLIEVNVGVYPEDVMERGEPRTAGSSITWLPADIDAGAITVERSVGVPLTLRWDEVEAGPGWNYIGAVVADGDAGRLLLASVMIDATWEHPDGTIESLDGTVDPLFQEVYLDPDAASLLGKLRPQVDPDAMASFAEAMRGEVHHYTQVVSDHGKASKRLYNLFRLTERFEAAAYVRELFDEPAAILYQVPGALDAARIALDPRAGIDLATVGRQLDTLTRACADVLEGEDEAAVVGGLDELRAHIDADGTWSDVAAQVASRCKRIVDEWFKARLLAHPEVAEAIAGGAAL